MEKYYCYFELALDSGQSDTAFNEYSMGGIPVRLAFNSDRLLSYLLLFYIINNKSIDVQDVVFISKNSIAWRLVESNSELFMITNCGDISVGVFDQINFPILEYGLVDYQKIYVQKVKILDQVYFESLKNMYEPNFDLIV